MAAFSMMSRLQSGLIAAVGTQAFLSLASLGYASGRLGGISEKFQADHQKNPRRKRVSLPEEAFDAHHYTMVTELIQGMYSGRRTRLGKGGSPPSPILAPGVQWADSATFEDPAAICRGPAEVGEAFRALSASLEPRSLSPPRCVDVEPKGESITLTYALNQQYGVMGRTFELQSLLIVDVQLRQLRDVPESEFLVLKVEEHWNGVPPLSSYLFWMVRRINGMVSYQLTRRFLL